MASDTVQSTETAQRLDYFHPEVVEHFESGVEQHRNGNFDAAELAYREVLRLTVDHPGALNLIGTIYHQKGDHKAALEYLDKAVSIAPANADFQINRGAAYFGMGDYENAIASFQKALEIDPDNSTVHGNITTALIEQGQLKEAHQHSEMAARLEPKNFKFAKRLADLSLQLSKFEDAIASFEQCLSINPEDPEVLSNLGYAWERVGDMEKAAHFYGEALDRHSTSPEIANNLSSVLFRLGRKEEAKQRLDQALSVNPDDWDDVLNLAGARLNAKDYEGAIESFEEGIEQQPDNHDLWAGYGNALTAVGRLEEADKAYDRALEINPDMAETWNNRGNVSMKMDYLEKAADEFKKAIEIAPNYPEPYINICLCLMFQQKIDEAYVYAQTTLSLPKCREDAFANPNKVLRGVCDFDTLEELGDLLTKLEQLKAGDIAACFLEMLPQCTDPEEIERLYRLHVKWGENLKRNLEEFEPLPPRPATAKNSKLKIGFLSTDLRSHSVANFVLPIFKHYDRKEVEVHCFVPHASEGDRVQERITKLVDGFHVLSHATDRAGAEAVQAQGIDVAFELNGFTRGSMLKSLLYRPAPVQVYWLGYPFTTGQSEIDHILVDNYFAPENLDWLAEKPLYMPDSWVCFDSFSDISVAEELPVERNGFLTFGTMNNPYKLTRDVIAVWATIMKQFEDSEFLIVRPEADSFVLQNNLREHFARCGVAPERIKFINNRKTNYPHFSFYNLMDISLDTFPQTGGTTTCDAIWMGVPVISLVGPSMHQRVSYSLLENAGCGELACFSLEEYLEKAVMLGNDLTSLREYRHNMRPALLNSPLCNAELFTENFQKIVIEAYEKSGA